MNRHILSYSKHRLNESMTNKKQFIAQRLVEDENVIVIIDVVTPHDGEEFIEKLKTAISEWGKSSSIGKRIIEESMNDFNFGDLMLYHGYPDLIEQLKKVDITNLDMTSLMVSDYVFNFDTILLPDE